MPTTYQYQKVLALTFYLAALQNKFRTHAPEEGCQQYNVLRYYGQRVKVEAYTFMHSIPIRYERLCSSNVQSDDVTLTVPMRV